MPCSCCAATKAPKGMNPEDLNKCINDALKLASNLIKERYSGPLHDEISWKKEWLIAFEHHLFGCPEKGEK